MGADKKPRQPHSPETIKQVGELVRAGIYNQTEISDRTGVPYKTVRHWIKKYEWTADLKTQVLVKTERKLAMQRVQKDEVAGMIDEAAAIEAASNDQVALINTHISDLAKIRQEVMASIAKLPPLEDLEEADRLNPDAQLDKVKAVSAYIGLSKMAAETLAKVIPLERQALGVDDKKSDPFSFDELMLLANSKGEEA